MGKERDDMESLAELLSAVPYDVLQGSSARSIAGVTANSRKVDAGWAFVAIVGSQSDGHDFIPQALQRGAAVIIVERAVPHALPPAVSVIRVRDGRRALASMAAAWHHHPSHELQLVGVTGTNGKTTSTYLLEAMWRAHGVTSGVLGTVSYRYAGHDQPADQTTPAPEALQSLLRQMVEARVSHCAMEVSSHALSQERVWGCRFAAALFTNLTQDHLDFHADMDAYYRAKARLFTEYQPGVAVVNRDDAAGQKLMADTRSPTITYGLTAAADVSVDQLRMDAQGIEMGARVCGVSIKLHSRLVGRHNVYNILGALATATGLGLDLQVAVRGVEQLRTVPGRFERVDAGQPFSVLVDYAHTADALRNVLMAARGIATGRVIIVFGAGGDRDRQKRPQMGRIAAECADMAFITSDNPRTEAPLDIIRAIEAGYREVGQATTYHIIEERAEAIRAALQLGQSGDVVVIAGKGHEPYQLIGSRRLPFDDRQVARKALQALGYSQVSPVPG
jgi:UDP-N-acetylmuramoyl-L-alanyl-D-glutamate--2,6-diaminopimelate ligase